MDDSAHSLRRSKRSRVSSSPSPLESANNDSSSPIREEENKTLILKIGPTANSSHEYRLGPKFNDFGGIEDIIRNLGSNVVTPLRDRLMPVTVGIGPLSGIILHGPSGCGKTGLAKAIGNETGLPFHMISAARVISGLPGITMKKIIEEAHRTGPSILFIDDLHAIGSQEDSLHRRRSKRIVKQMMECMERSIQTLHVMNSDPNEDPSDEKSGYVLVIGATNRIDSLEPELRRPGYFDREIHLRIPDENDRHEILVLLTQIRKCGDTVDLAKIASTTTGFVGANLKALVDQARRLSQRRVMSEIESEIPYSQRREWNFQAWGQEVKARLHISMDDFEEAVKRVQPST